MRALLLIVIVIGACNGVLAQTDTPNEPVTNNGFTNIAAAINYTYNATTQTHDYSGNWDFDADGKLDEVYFTSNLGAHAYYSLSIVLSSTQKKQNFSFLLLDFPLVGTIEDLEKATFYPLPVLPQFVVYDFDTDGADEMFIQLDIPTFSAVKKELETYKATQRYLLLNYSNKHFNLSNFIE